MYVYMSLHPGFLFTPGSKQVYVMVVAGVEGISWAWQCFTHASSWCTHSKASLRQDPRRWVAITNTFTIIMIHE